MAQQLTFDPESLRAGGAQLTTAGTDLASQFQSLAANAPTWGADDISGLCQMVYEAIVAVVQESTSGVSEAWADHGEKLTTAAQVYEQTESDNASSASTMVQEA